MASHAYRPVKSYEVTPARRRLSGAALTLAIELLLALLVLGLGTATVIPMHDAGGPVMINVGPEHHNQAQAAARQSPRAASKPQVAHPPVLPPHPIPTARSVPAPPPTKLVPMSSADMAAADISKLGSNAPGGAPGDSEAVGTGPNGETLYAAEWARHPTSTELGGYLPPNPQDGYGRVACKTVPDNRVDDCIELESAPLSSRLARAVRLAAWQFRVRPPRKNGRPMIGQWVVIQIDYDFGGRDER